MEAREYEQLVKALRKQLREAHESYERHINEFEAEVKRLKMHCADCEYGNSPWPEEPVHEPKRGEWIRKDAELYYWHECSKRGERPLYDRCANKVLSAYCPNCGARMEAHE